MACPSLLSITTIGMADQFIDCPYYLTNQSITVFSEKKAFELMLFSDDIRKYGLIKAINARKESEWFNQFPIDFVVEMPYNTYIDS